MVALETEVAVEFVLETFAVSLLKGGAVESNFCAFCVSRGGCSCNFAEEVAFCSSSLIVFVSCRCCWRSVSSCAFVVATKDLEAERVDAFFYTENNSSDQAENQKSRQGW